MEQEKLLQDELFIAGIGGMGVLFIGSLIANVAFNKYEHVAWLPSYGVQPRGGLSECTVIFSNERIASPMLDQTNTVILIDGSQSALLENRVRPGGLLITDKTGIGKISRKDIKSVVLPAMDTAVKTFGNASSTNLVLLGAYISLTNVMPAEHIFKELETKFSAKKDILSRNSMALEKGIEIGKSVEI